MTDPHRDERWKDAYRLARRVSRIEKRLKQKNALLPQHKQKIISKDKRLKDAIHAYFMASINALRTV